MNHILTPCYRPSPHETMRLLQRSNTEELSFSRNFVGKDTIPPYAILSHTWGADAEEVTFEDLTKGTGKDKPGYEKIRFCGEQAKQDDLEYFWVDTCCINKADFIELSEAINSMFCWYRNAARCYVYLSDVSSSVFDTKEESNPRPWESDFQKSRWFTRGWTLQELLAPSSVEFFSQERKRLGDKESLKQQIHKITGIPESALQGAVLSQFSVDERFSWAKYRETKFEEDKAYSLLGTFEIYMPLIYGEGEENAFKRLRTLIQRVKDQEYIQHLRLTDPRDDKKRIEETKGGLLEDSYHWILENSDFQQWRHDQQSRLLWIKGDPGTGKTMLLCGIVNELKKSMAKTDLLSYFFCQATDSRINNAIAVLRGLVYLLIDQQPSLISYIWKKYDYAGKIVFEDANAWVTLSEIFTNILQDPSLNSTYLIIDALDECITDLPRLLDLIVQKSSVSRIKWIVSSRNWPDIEERLERAGHKVRLCLELNAESISTAVSIYIQHKTLHLAKLKKYDDKTRVAVLQYLALNANDTFLWVALVCQNLEKIPQWKTLAKLNAFPPGLDSLYQRMMEQICYSDHADLCKRILALTAIIYQPVILKELTSLVEMLEGMSDDLESLREIIGLCGSFLTIREETIYFVHQSAKDYLLINAFNKIFPAGKQETHHEIFSRSLKILSRTLRRDIYSLGALGFPIKQVKQPNPDPLVASRYSCIFWVDHLYDWSSNSRANNWIDLRDKDTVENFVRTKFLYWLEALSLYRSMSKGVVSMAKLEALVQVILSPAFVYKTC
jgi:NACHT domain/Heterokaryon incompatibility protein (HET)